MSDQGELLPIKPDRRDVVRVEKNLNSFGFFTPAHKRLSTVHEKSVTIFVKETNGQRAEARAVILPSAKLGLPTTADQDKYYAFQKIVDGIRRREGKVANPIAFTSAQMLKMLGRKKSGQGYREIGDWLERMTLTGIRSEGVVWLAGIKKYARDTFTVFSRVVTVGQELPDGRMAEKNYVWLSDWQLENLNHSYVLPIDYEIYKSLRLNISKALVPLMQVWFYASRRNPNLCIEKRYSELCQILSIRRYPHLSKIKEVLGPSLDELAEAKVLQTWEIERTIDGTDYKLLLVPGERFLSGNQLRAGSEPARELPDPHLEKLLRAMLDRGIREDWARRMLLDIPSAQDAFDQIEYGDAEIARRQGTRHAIANPSGFYIYLLKTNFPVPSSFETSRKKDLRRVAAEREKAAQAAEAQRELKLLELKEAYEEYRNTKIDEYMRQHFTAAELDRRVRAAKKAIARERPDMVLPEPAASEYALRRVREGFAASMQLMTFEEFCNRSQLSLPL